MSLRSVIRCVLILSCTILLPFTALEYFVKSTLFHHVSYSNSDALDRSLEDFSRRNARDWDILILGDSEVRWGFNPMPMEQVLSTESDQIQIMNFAMDGFSTGWSPKISELMRLRERMPNLKIVVFGVQMVELQEIVTDANVCGAADENGGFQATILKSAFAKDWRLLRNCGGIRSLTERTTRVAESLSSTIRYRSNIKSVVLGTPNETPTMGISDVALPTSYNGFQPHVPAQQNGSYEYDLQRKVDEISNNAHSSSPLEPGSWNGAVRQDGYFDQISNDFKQAGILPVFVALPTNPLLVDLKNRRSTYAENSALMKDYAKRSETVFIDLGIRDTFAPRTDFTDYRHLSGQGADKYSSELARAMLDEPLILQALAE